jgi:hypothetical protein
MRTGTGRAPWRCRRMSVAVLGLIVAGCGDRPENDSRTGRPADGGLRPASDPAGRSSHSSAEASAPADSGSVPIDIKVVLSGQEIRANGLGECHHITDGSIYEAPAAQWTAMYSGSADAELQHLNLTVWQLKNSGPPQLTLAVLASSGRHDIATVKGGPLKGTGSASVQPGGAAGTLSVTGKDDGGNQLLVSVSCARFTEPVAEGG